MKHFLDTYALIEILNGNSAYEGVMEEAGTSLYNLYEMHVQAARLQGPEQADRAFRDLRAMAVEVFDEEVLAASRFKRAHSKARYSYVDALGYAIARARDVPFVTGDKLFRSLDGVKFIAGRARV